jgi:hypothetical protein
MPLGERISAGKAMANGRSLVRTRNLVSIIGLKMRDTAVEKEEVDLKR